MAYKFLHQLWLINLSQQIQHTSVQEYNISLPIYHTFVSRYPYHSYPTSVGLSGSSSGTEKGRSRRGPTSIVSVHMIWAISSKAATSLLRFRSIAGLCTCFRLPRGAVPSIGSLAGLAPSFQRLAAHHLRPPALVGALLRGIATGLRHVLQETCRIYGVFLASPFCLAPPTQGAPFTYRPLSSPCLSAGRPSCDTRVVHGIYAS